MNIVVGEFSSTELYCLGAPLETIPREGHVAYDIDAGFREKINSLFQDLRENGDT